MQSGVVISVCVLDVIIYYTWLNLIFVIILLGYVHRYVTDLIRDIAR